jgi:hypothetical protein
MEDNKLILDGIEISDDEEVTEDTLESLSNNRGEDE